MKDCRRKRQPRHTPPGVSMGRCPASRWSMAAWSNSMAWYRRSRSGMTCACAGTLARHAGISALDGTSSVIVKHALISLASCLRCSCPMKTTVAGSISAVATRRLPTSGNAWTTYSIPMASTKQSGTTMGDSFQAVRRWSPRASTTCSNCGSESMATRSSSTQVISMAPTPRLVG